MLLVLRNFQLLICVLFQASIRQQAVCSSLHLAGGLSSSQGDPHVPPGGDSSQAWGGGAHADSPRGGSSPSRLRQGSPKQHDSFASSFHPSEWGQKDSFDSTFPPDMSQHDSFNASFPADDSALPAHHQQDSFETSFPADESSVPAQQDSFQTSFPAPDSPNVFATAFPEDKQGIMPDDNSFQTSFPPSGVDFTTGADSSILSYRLWHFLAVFPWLSPLSRLALSYLRASCCEGLTHPCQ